VVHNRVPDSLVHYLMLCSMTQMYVANDRLLQNRAGVIDNNLNPRCLRILYPQTMARDSKYRGGRSFENSSTGTALLTAAAAAAAQVGFEIKQSRCCV